MGNNQFSGRIPTSIGQCKRLFSLDLRMNRLRGTIPKEIFQLSYLTSLYLAGNSLHGSLPPEVGTMTQLETLDSSSNNLVGPIPVSLENLHYLQKLNLSFNHLEGEVESLSAGDTATLAVKVPDLQQSKASKSFSAECEALKNVRHQNLVKVITSCSSLDYNGEEFKALVVQFIIAIDVAYAVEYLHHYCHPPIAHCDLKPANVLLDENMTAHVVDFGLARFLSQSTSEKQSSTLGLKGSIGYIAPEYGFGSKASTEGDVYSFGILVLEMFTGKRPTDEMFKEGLSLRKFVSGMDENEVVKMGGDRRLIEDYGYSTQSSNSDDHSSGFGSNTHWMRKAEECMADVIRVGLSCTADQPKERWNIREALSKLQAINHSMLPF
ncbi:hypothetical protein VNO80_18872 [Phaseolus coccineus]|uniref:non-specific serine/threonine protein kinase n=1 Tax=Phaseolus coccineus TaxID=3886 RepID=A0AAN9MEX9_PHACN